MKAVVLLSGGLDSATTAYIARDAGYDIYALTVIYGQRHAREVASAKKVAAAAGATEHIVIDIPLGRWGGSALTDSDIDIPEPGGEGIPATYVPARNLVLLSIAGSWAEVVGAEAIYLGATQVDYSGYPDCREDFLSSFETTLSLGTRAGRNGNGVRVVAPLLHLSKAEIIGKGVSLGVDYSLTWSCYRGGDAPCGRCDSCVLRARGFAEAGITDPALEVSD